MKGDEMSKYDGITGWMTQSVPQMGEGRNE